MVWVWKFSPKNFKFFNFFSLGQKKSLRVGSKSIWIKGGLASYLLGVKSKLELGQGPSLDYSQYVMHKNIIELIFYFIKKGSKDGAYQQQQLARLQRNSNHI